MSGRAYDNVQFMKQETDRAKKELDDIENQLTDFQLQNQGKLPDQADANLRSMMALDTTLTSLNSNISRTTSEKLQLEATIRNLQEQKKDIAKLYLDAPTVTSTQRNERLQEAERDVQKLEDSLRILRQKYTDNHPDIQTFIGQLAAAKQKQEELQKEDDQKKDEAKKEDAAKAAKGESSPRVNPALVREQMGRDSQIQSLQVAVEAKSKEIEDMQKQIKKTSDEVKILEGRLSSMPLGMKQYTDLMRDREAAKAKYLQLDENLSKAQRSQDMEQSNQGERLEPLDTASLPTDPHEPNRPMVISIGAGIGLLLGIVIAGAREMRDTSLKNLKDVRAYTQMAVLGSIPLLENDFVVRRRRRLAWLGWTTACLVSVVVMVGAIVYYTAATRGGGQ
jgi:polysaccharide biosynthesis transport protein